MNGRELIVLDYNGYRSDVHGVYLSHQDIDLVLLPTHHQRINFQDLCISCVDIHRVRGRILCGLYLRHRLLLFSSGGLLAPLRYYVETTK